MPYKIKLFYVFLNKGIRQEEWEQGSCSERLSSCFSCLWSYQAFHVSNSHRIHDYFKVSILILMFLFMRKNDMKFKTFLFCCEGPYMRNTLWRTWGGRAWNFVWLWRHTLHVFKGCYYNYDYDDNKSFLSLSRVHWSQGCNMHILHMCLVLSEWFFHLLISKFYYCSSLYQIFGAYGILTSYIKHFYNKY